MQFWLGLMKLSVKDLLDLLVRIKSCANIFSLQNLQVFFFFFWHTLYFETVMSY